MPARPALPALIAVLLLGSAASDRIAFAEWKCRPDPVARTWDCAESPPTAAAKSAQRPPIPPDPPSDAATPTPPPRAQSVINQPSAEAAATASPESPDNSEKSGSAAETPSDAAPESAREADPTVGPDIADNADPDPARLYQDPPWLYCGPPPGKSGFALPSAADENALVELSADAAELFYRENRAVLRGDVEVRRGTQHIEAREIAYDRDSGLIEARGGVLLRQPGLAVLSREAQVDLPQRKGEARDARYRLSGSNARGQAERIFIESNTLSRYENITYTTCAPGSDAWRLEAARLEVDREENRGVARDAKLRVGGVPLLYTPYISFPLDRQRKTGLLVPSVGNSNKLGIDVSTPYYVNLAPNMDATLIPRYMSKRGFMLGSEFRFLTAREKGSVYAEYLPDDSEFNDGNSRGGLSLRQNGAFGPRWATEIRFNWVSDDTYLEDFGRDLRVTSTRNLERRGDVSYYGDGWYALGRVQGFQTVDRSIAPEDRPYDRLPQLLFVLDPPSTWHGLDLRLEAENVYFDHTDKVHGNRLAFRPTVSLPLRRPYGHLIPRVTANHASYWLSDQTPGQPDRPSLTVPTVSLDAGLTFERRLRWFSREATQTLEPRIFYLYTPYEEQDDLPLFDSAELDFSFASLFRENRFSGRDRIGDANQLTLALTSRTIDDANGRELFRGSIGQILYFEDRRVQLEGGVDDVGTSAVAGEIAARLSDSWSGRASVLWDPNRGEEQVRKSSVGVHYRSSGRHLANLSYRLNRSDDDETDYEDTDFSLRWPVNEQFELVGRWLYSMRHDKTMEAFAGIQYGECCWRVRVLVRDFVNSPEEGSNLSVMLQLELMGLGEFGDNIEDFLQSGVYGYEVD